MRHVQLSVRKNIVGGNPSKTVQSHGPSAFQHGPWQQIWMNLTNQFDVKNIKILLSKPALANFGL
jgi:hypothetical protein